MGLAKAWGLENKFVVGYVGTHGMAHGLRNVLDTAERLKGVDGLRFLLAGAGAERDALIAEAQRRDLDNIVFMPAQPKDAMPAVWSLCDVALVHLKNDPVFAGVIPSKIFEAMASGLAVLLAAPKGEASRIIETDGAGVWVAAEDPDALAIATRQLMDDGPGLKALADNSLAAATRHSREAQARHMAEVLKLSAGRRGVEASSVPPGGR
jgi:glycosyltransferase involved in cell wall biosynthesis